MPVVMGVFLIQCRRIVYEEEVRFLTIASSGSSEGSIPNSNPCPAGARGAPSSPSRIGEERRTSDNRGPGRAVTR